MISVDTNIIVRLLTQDDQQQYQKSFDLFQTQDIFISDTVILETEWVLRFAYKFTPNQICQGFKNLFGLPNVYISNEQLMLEVLQWHENGLDFADALHLASSKNCSSFYTFDIKFLRKAQELKVYDVRNP